MRRHELDVCEERAFGLARPNRSSSVDNRNSKVNKFRCLLPMFVQEMPVDFADENPAILMSQPGGDRHEIDPGHHAYGTQVMSQVVKTHPWKSGGCPRQFQAFTKTPRVLVSCPALRRGEKPRAIGCTSRKHF